MSIGLSLISAVISTGSRSAVRELTPELFDESELGAYRFLSDFYARHNALPSREVMAENGLPLPVANDPVSYYTTRAQDRRVFNVCRDFQTQSRELVQRRDTEALRGLIRQASIDVQAVTGGSAVRELTEMMFESLEEARQLRLNNTTGLTGVTLGWPTLDELTGGAQNGDLISVVARPNVGKTWTLIHMALQAWQAGYSVLFNTNEMTGAQIARRALAESVGVDPNYLKRGQLTMHLENDMQEFIEAANDMAPFRLLGDTLRGTVGQLDRAVQEFSPDIVFSDAAYLLRPEKPSSRNGSRWERVYDLGEEMKALAMNRNRPVVQSLQLSREKKKSDEFDLSQIAGGDVIGQISSVVLAIDFGEGDNETSTRRHTVGKNREGSLGKYSINYLFSPLNFDELPPEDDAGASAQARLERIM